MKTPRIAAFALLAAAGVQAPSDGTLPSTPLAFGVFTARFGADGSFTLEGEGWGRFRGTWKRDGNAVEIETTGGEGDCRGAGRYRAFAPDTPSNGARVAFEVIADACTPRRMI